MNSGRNRVFAEEPQLNHLTVKKIIGEAGKKVSQKVSSPAISFTGIQL